MSLLNPERFPVKFYSWQDQDAPQLSNVDGAIKTIIKACLVTGYGDKQSAGWTSLFEDDYRIVLQRALRTGNPPDVKIENGTVNGVVSHRIVLMNATSLDDTELTSERLIARDKNFNPNWFLFVTDFAFLFVYGMGTDNYRYDKNTMLYCGSILSFERSHHNFFINGTSGINQNGTIVNTDYPFLSQSNVVFKQQNNINIKKLFHTSNNINGVAQNIIIDGIGIMPFFCDFSENVRTSISEKIYLNARPMFKFLNRAYSSSGSRIMYIPLDYWEL